ncbi:MAG: hypothetical protein V4535_07370 [Bacteroidota bacterium]
MKNILKSSLYLIAFAGAGILFQISCSAEDSTTLLTDKLIYTVFNPSGQSIWTSDYDGTNQTQVPITLPANIEFNATNGNADAKLSPDGQKIFFIVWNTTSGGNEIYSCDISGANVQQVVFPSVPSTVSVNVN